MSTLLTLEKMEATWARVVHWRTPIKLTPGGDWSREWTRGPVSSEVEIRGRMPPGVGKVIWPEAS
jgi:hypothetical protein